MDANDVLAALIAVGHKSRLAIFWLLVQVGPNGMAATRIAEQLDIVPSSLSFQLKELTYAKLINSRSEGRFIIYSTDVAVMNGLIAYLTENCRRGVACGLVDAGTSDAASITDKSA